MCKMPKCDTDAKVTELAQEIERYLADHPRAADTAEGILGWWLPRQRCNESLTRVQQALDRLEANGAIVKTVLPGGNVIYSRRVGGPPCNQ